MFPRRNDADAAQGQNPMARQTSWGLRHG